jgi:hypothetical protein
MMLHTLADLFYSSGTTETNVSDQELYDLKIAALTSKLKSLRTTHAEDKALLATAQSDVRDLQERLVVAENLLDETLANVDTRERELAIDLLEKAKDDLNLAEKRRNTLMDKHLVLQDEYEKLRMENGSSNVRRIAPN